MDKAGWHSLVAHIGSVREEATSFCLASHASSPGGETGTSARGICLGCITSNHREIVPEHKEQWESLWVQGMGRQQGAFLASSRQGSLGLGVV